MWRIVSGRRYVVSPKGNSPAKTSGVGVGEIVGVGEGVDDGAGVGLLVAVTVCVGLSAFGGSAWNEAVPARPHAVSEMANVVRSK